MTENIHLAALSTDERVTYERSYKRMWEEVARARRDRDRAIAGLDAARDLVVALEHDVELYRLVLSKPTFDALARLAASLHIITGRPGGPQ